MTLKIRYIRDNGEYEEERVVLEALKDCDIGFYLILDTTYDDEGMVSNKLRHPFWFPDQLVKAGDLIVLYTKKGTPSTKRNESGRTSYFYYWGLGKSIINNDKDCIVLIEAKSWSANGVDG